MKKKVVKEYINNTMINNTKEIFSVGLRPLGVPSTKDFAFLNFFIIWNIQEPVSLRVLQIFGPPAKYIELTQKFNAPSNFGSPNAEYCNL